VVWGLLAFKPVWALAFFLVPLVTRRWRTCLAMAGTGAALALTTVPFVGWQCWLE
jgi:arabinofuranan 3-O-arabinosyltransferase